jgi:hypothetical protein
MAGLGIADILSVGPVHVEELARRTKTHAPSLKRVLRLLVTAALSRKTGRDGTHGNRRLPAHGCARPNAFRRAAVRRHHRACLG